MGFIKKSYFKNKKNNKNKIKGVWRQQKNQGGIFGNFLSWIIFLLCPKMRKKYKFEVKIKSKIIIIFFIGQFDLIMG